MVGHVLTHSLSGTSLTLLPTALCTCHSLWLDNLPPKLVLVSAERSLLGVAFLDLPNYNSTYRGLAGYQSGLIKVNRQGTKRKCNSPGNIFLKQKCLMLSQIKITMSHPVCLLRKENRFQETDTVSGHFSLNKIWNGRNKILESIYLWVIFCFLIPFNFSPIHITYVINFF